MSVNVNKLRKGMVLVTIGNKHIPWGGCSPVEDYLSIGELCIVEKYEIHSWHTRIWIKGIPGEYFNSVHFEKAGFWRQLFYRLVRVFSDCKRYNSGEKCNYQRKWWKFWRVT